MRRKVPVAFAVVGLLVLGQSSLQAQSRATAMAPGQLLVKFRPGLSASDKADAHQQAGGIRLAAIARTSVELIAVSAGDEAPSIARYRRNPNVLYAEPNYIRRLPEPLAHSAGSEVMPGDYYWNEQWALHNTGQMFECWFPGWCFYVGTPDADVDGPEAWAISQGSSNVKVAVIDSGIDYNHPDLVANYAGGRNFVGGADPMDDHGHGTHVSGTIAAALNNLTSGEEEGVVGVAPNVRLLAYKVCMADGTCDDFAIQQAIAQAITEGAKVINMSLGETARSETLNAAIQDAWAAGLVIVAAAGNNGDTVPFYPAAFDNVISVAAFDEDHKRASFSTYGSWVDISAPGNEIMSSYPLAACSGGATTPGDTGCYTWMSGTSMASPHAAGAAALVWSRADVTTNSQVVTILLGSADPQGVSATRLDSWTIHGGLNLHDALSFATTTPPPPEPTIDTVSVLKATYARRRQLLTVEATSTAAPDVTLTVYDITTGVDRLVGALQYNARKGSYTGSFTTSTGPTTVRVDSSGGGSATRAVTIK